MVIIACIVNIKPSGVWTQSHIAQSDLREKVNQHVSKEIVSFKLGLIEELLGPDKGVQLINGLLLNLVKLNLHLLGKPYKLYRLDLVQSVLVLNAKLDEVINVSNSLVYSLYLLGWWDLDFWRLNVNLLI